MTVLKRVSLYLAGLSGLLLILCLGALIYLGTSQEGARRLFELAKTWLPGELSADSLQGRLAGPLVVKGLRYRQPDGLAFESEILRFDWRPSALLGWRLHILEFELRQSALTLPESEPETTASEPFRGLSLPLAVTLEHFFSEDFLVAPAVDQDPVVIERVEFKAATEGERLLISKLGVEALSAVVDLDGWVGLNESLPLAVNLAWRYSLPDGPELSGEGEISGDLQRMRLQQKLAPPLSGDLDASLSALLESPSWEAVLALDEARLSEFMQGFPARVRGRLSARGNLEQARLESEMHLSEASLGELDGQVTASYAAGRVEVESLMLTNPQALRIEGQGEYRLQQQTLSAGLRWHDLRWPLVGEQETIRSKQGELSLEGTLDRYRYQLAMGVSGAELPAVELTASGAGNQAGLELEQLVLMQHESRIAGSGEVDWSPVVQWRLMLDGEKINPALLASDFPGELAFRLDSEGVIQDGEPRGELHLEKLSGTLRDYPLEAQGRLRYQKDSLALQEMLLHSGPNLIRAEGELGEVLGLDWSVEAPDLSSLWPGLSGVVNASGTLSGRLEAPGVEVELSAANLTFQTLGVEQLEAGLDLDMAGEQPIALSLNGRGLAGAGRHWERLEAEVRGTLPEHRLSLGLEGTEVPQLSLAARAGLDSAYNWQGRLQQLRAEAPQLGKWRLAAPVEYRLGALEQELERFCLASGASRVCGRFVASADQGWRSELEMSDFGLDRLQAWLPDATRLAGRLAMKAEISSDDSARLEADVEASIPQGEVSFILDGDKQPVDFSETSLTARLDAEGVVARVDLPLQTLGGFKAELALPGFEVTGENPGQQRVSGQISGAIENLAILSLIAPRLQNSRGRLLVDFGLDGELAAPLLKGEARLEDGAFDIPELGVELRDFALRIEAPDLDTLAVNGSLRSGGGKLSLQGTTRLDAAQGFPSEYRIKGKEWLALDVPEAEVQITPNLIFKHHAQGSELSGELHIPYARLRPRELPQSAVSVSSDMVVTGGEQEQPAQSDAPLHAKIRLSLGKRVSFDGFGLRGNFTGSLLVIDEPGRPVIGRGRLGIADGVYQAYGQDLKIERGFALFADNPVENPGLDVRAVREIEEVTAGMRVTGTLKTPKLTLFSTPVMAESDVLAYLLTGRAPGGSSGQTFGLAAALKASGASNIASELARRIGLEELRVDTGGSLEEASLVAGTYLSPRLYVQYINELSTSETKLRMRYDLTDRWQLEAETGRTQAGDFFYTFER